MNKSPNAIYVGDDVELLDGTPAKVAAVPLGDSRHWKLSYTNEEGASILRESKRRNEFVWPIRLVD